MQRGQIRPTGYRWSPSGASEHAWPLDHLAPSGKHSGGREAAWSWRGTSRSAPSAIRRRANRLSYRQLLDAERRKAVAR